MSRSLKRGDTMKLHTMVVVTVLLVFAGCTKPTQVVERQFAYPDITTVHATVQGFGYTTLGSGDFAAEFQMAGSRAMEMIAKQIKGRPFEYDTAGQSLKISNSDVLLKGFKPVRSRVGNVYLVQISGKMDIETPHSAIPCDAMEATLTSRNQFEQFPDAVLRFAEQLISRQYVNEDVKKINGKLWMKIDIGDSTETGSQQLKIKAKVCAFAHRIAREEVVE